MGFNSAFKGLTADQNLETSLLSQQIADGI